MCLGKESTWLLPNLPIVKGLHKLPMSSNSHNLLSCFLCHWPHWNDQLIHFVCKESTGVINLKHYKLNKNKTCQLQYFVTPHVVALSFIVTRAHQKIIAFFYCINFEYYKKFCKKMFLYFSFYLFSFECM